MATCSDIITYAMRLAKVLPSGDSPSSEEAADGLVALQSFYDQMVNDGMFGRLLDVYETQDYEAAEGERVLTPAGVTVTFPTTLEDDENGGDRRPRDLSIIETIIDTTRTVKIWDRTGWVDLLGLEAADTAPLSARGAFALAAAFGMSGAFIGMFGGQLDGDARLMGIRFLEGVSAKRGSSRDYLKSEYF